MNVTTLGDGIRNASLLESARSKAIKKQCSEQKINVAFVQEARTAEGSTENDEYITLCSGSSSGQLGCEV